MHGFWPEPKRCTDSGQKRNERTQSTFLDTIVMFWFVLVSFVTVQKNMPKLHLKLRFGPEPKRTADSVQKGNERTQSTFLDPIVMFWFVLVSFVTVQKPCRSCIYAPIRAGTKTNYRFGPEMKRTYPIHFFGPNSDVLVRFGQFRYCAKNHAKVAFMLRFGPEPKRTTDSGQKQNERTRFTFLDPIVMFLVRFGQFRYC